MSKENNIHASTVRCSCGSIADACMLNRRCPICGTIIKPRDIPDWQKNFNGDDYEFEAYYVNSLRGDNEYINISIFRTTFEAFTSRYNIDGFIKVIDSSNWAYFSFEDYRDMVTLTSSDALIKLALTEEQQASPWISTFTNANFRELILTNAYNMMLASFSDQQFNAFSNVLKVANSADVFKNTQLARVLTRTTFKPRTMLKDLKYTVLLSELYNKRLVISSSTFYLIEQLINNPFIPSYFHPRRTEGYIDEEKFDAFNDDMKEEWYQQESFIELLFNSSKSAKDIPVSPSTLIQMTNYSIYKRIVNKIGDDKIFVDTCFTDHKDMYGNNLYVGDVVETTWLLYPTLGIIYIENGEYKIMVYDHHSLSSKYKVRTLGKDIDSSQVRVAKGDMYQTIYNERSKLYGTDE